MKTVAITGPTGAIGVALINKCIEENVKVIAYVRPGSKRRGNIPKSPLVTVAGYDLCEFEKMARLSKVISIPRVDAFFHLGWGGTIGEARNDGELQVSNIDYTMDAVRLAKAMGAGVFIGIGSQAEYGRVDGILKPDTPTNPENGYGVAKLAAGQLSRMYCEKLGLKHIWVRVLSVYGPYDGEGTMIMSTIRRLINGEKPLLTEGRQIWDYLYSKDAARALYMLGKLSCDDPEQGDDLHGKVYCLGSGEGKPLRDYVSIMRDSIDPSLPLGFGEVPYSEKQVMHLCADISALTNDIGFKPEISFEKGILETINYARENPCR